MAKLRVRPVAESRGLNLNQLIVRLNTVRAQRGAGFVAAPTVRRYWHNTQDGRLQSKELDFISWSFLHELADTLDVPVADLLPEDAANATN